MNHTQQTIEQLLRFSHDWINDPARARQEINYRLAVEGIRRAFGKRNERDLAKLSSCLDAYASWEAMQGVVDVVAGNVAGWARLRKSMAFHYWALRIVIELYNRDQRPNKQFRIGLREGALNVAHSLAIGATDAADWIGARLLSSFHEPPFGYWTNTPLEPFIAHLYGVCNSIPKAKLPDLHYLGVYREVVEAWDVGGPALEHALMRSCDYHLNRVGLTGDDEDQEFQLPPYFLFPAEILAVTRVRAQLGLTMPDLKHPLMQTPLAHPPDKTQLVNDDLLREVEATITAAFSAA